MKKCDVCKKTTVLPEVLGDVNICKICFFKIQGPIWKYRTFENLKDAEKAKSKAIKLAKNANYPESISIGIEKYFEQNNLNMQQCDACKEFVLTIKNIGNNKLCKKCFTKINTSDWKRNEFESNEDVEKSRNKILYIAKSNNFSDSIINDINNHFDKKIQKGLFRIKNGSTGQTLKVFDTHCVLITRDSFDIEEISIEYGQALKSVQPSKGLLPDNAGETLVKGFLKGGFVKAGVSLATSAAVNAVGNKVIPSKGQFKVIKGSYTINYIDYNYVDYQKVGDNEVGFLRFRNSLSQGSQPEDIVFFFRSDSHINKIYDYIQEQMRNVRNSKISTTISKESVPDEILKYKNLLDMGAITKKEYEKKKKELLNFKIEDNK